MFNPLAGITAQRKPDHQMVHERLSVQRLIVTDSVNQIGEANFNTEGDETTNIGTGSSGEVNIGNTVGGTHITGPLTADGDFALEGDFTQEGLFIHDGGDCYINASGSYNTYIGVDSSGRVELGNSVGGVFVNGPFDQCNGDCNINTSGSYTTYINTSASGEVEIGNIVGGTTIYGDVDMEEGDLTVLDGDITVSDGDITVEGYVITASGLMSTRNTMPKIPYMPYDEVMVHYAPLSDISGITMILQTNWLADSWSCSVQYDSVGDYTFRLTPYGHGGISFGTVYFTGFQSSANAVVASYQTTWTSATCHVRTVDYEGDSYEANGFYTFKIARLDD